MNYSKYRTLLRYVQEMGDATRERKQARRRAALPEFFDKYGGFRGWKAQEYLVRGLERSREAPKGWKPRPARRDGADQDRQDRLDYRLSLLGVDAGPGFYSRLAGEFTIRLDFRGGASRVTVYGPKYSAWVGDLSQGDGRDLFMLLRAENVATCKDLRRVR